MLPFAANVYEGARGRNKKLRIKSVFNGDEEDGVWNGSRKCIGFALNYQLDDSLFTRILFFFFQFKFFCVERVPQSKSKITLSSTSQRGHFSNVHELDFFPIFFFFQTLEFLLWYKRKKELNANGASVNIIWRNKSDVNSEHNERRCADGTTLVYLYLHKRFPIKSRSLIK